jgi:hypothetical protein
MPAYTDFGRKVAMDPEAARAEFLAAFEKVKGRRTSIRRPGHSVLKELGCSSHSMFYAWVEALGIDLQKLDKAGIAMGWPSRRSGGGGFHKNPALRAKKAAQTMEDQGISPGRKAAKRKRSIRSRAK